MGKINLFQQAPKDNVNRSSSGFRKILLLLTIIAFIKNKSFLVDIATLVNIRVRLYEIPFFLITAYFMYISLWKCYFYPVG